MLYGIQPQNDMRNLMSNMVYSIRYSYGMRVIMSNMMCAIQMHIIWFWVLDRFNNHILFSNIILKRKKWPKTSKKKKSFCFLPFEFYFSFVNLLVVSSHKSFWTFYWELTHFCWLKCLVPSFKPKSDYTSISFFWVSYMPISKPSSMLMWRQDFKSLQVIFFC